MQKQSKPTSFFYWGRKHVHGTHVLEGFLEALSEWGGESVEDVNLTMLKHIDHQGHYVLYPSKEDLVADKEKLHAELRGTMDGESFYAGLVCDRGEVEETVPDDEPTLVDEATVDTESKTILIPAPGRERIFTRLVAMNKSLLKALVSDEGYTPWRLARLSFKLKDVGWKQGNATVCLVNNVGNMMTRSKISYDDVVVGEIQFARRRV